MDKKVYKIEIQWHPRDAWESWISTLTLPQVQTLHKGFSKAQKAGIINVYNINPIYPYDHTSFAHIMDYLRMTEIGRAFGEKEWAPD